MKFNFLFFAIAAMILCSGAFAKDYKKPIFADVGLVISGDSNVAACTPISCTYNFNIENNFGKAIIDLNLSAYFDNNAVLFKFFELVPRSVDNSFDECQTVSCVKENDINGACIEYGCTKYKVVTRIDTVYDKVLFNPVIPTVSQYVYNSKVFKEKVKQKQSVSKKTGTRILSWNSIILT